MKYRVLIYEGETGEILQDVQIYNQLFDNLPVKKVVTFLNTLRKDHKKKEVKENEICTDSHTAENQRTFK